MSVLEPAEREWLADQPSGTQEFVRAFADNRTMVQLQLSIAGYRPPRSVAPPAETTWSDLEARSVGWHHRMAEWADPALKRTRHHQLEAFFAAEWRLDRDMQLYGHTQQMATLIARVNHMRAQAGEQYREGCCKERNGTNQKARDEGKRIIRAAMNTYEGLVMQMDQQLNLLAFITTLSRDDRPESRQLVQELRQKTLACTSLGQQVATVDHLTKQHHIPVRN